MSLDSLRGLADPTRREILERLSDGGLPVHEIAAGLPMSRPAVSKHLKILRELGLVVETKVGRQRVYELVAEPLEEVAVWIVTLAESDAARRDVTSRASPAGAPLPVEGGPDLSGSHRESPAADRAVRGDDGEDRWRSW